MTMCYRLKLVPVFCAAILIQAWPANAQTIDPVFRAEIEKLLEVTGAAQIGAQSASLITKQLLDGLKKSQPTIPDRALELAKQVLDAEFAKSFAGPDSLVEQTIAIYARNFTQEEVRALLAFYSSDVGKKVTAAMPVILRETGAAGQQWVAKQLPTIVSAMQARLRAEGFIK